MTLKYVFANNTSLEKSILVNSELTIKDYDNVDEILDCIKNNNIVKISNFKVVGYLNFINFYNNMVDIEKFMISLEEVIEDFEEDVNEIAIYLETKYSNMGLNREYYLNYLNKYM